MIHVNKHDKMRSYGSIGNILPILRMGNKLKLNILYKKWAKFAQLLLDWQFIARFVETRFIAFAERGWKQCAY